MSKWGPYLQCPKKESIFFLNTIILKDIGRGGYSFVKLAKHRESGDKVALKITPREELSADEEVVINNEIRAMREVNHPNIVKLHDFDINWEYITRYGDARDVCYLALELCQGGDIFDWVAETGSFSDILSRFYFHQLIEGLGYLHGIGVSHRDLKLENILFNDKYDLKIADFGFASISLTNKTRRGTQGYTRFL